MRLNIFRRRAVDPADLPPVSACSVPGPLHSGLTGDLPAVPRPPLPVRKPAPVATPHPAGLDGVANHTLDAVDPAPTWPSQNTAPTPRPADTIPSMSGIPAPLWRPGTYTVTYDRIGPYGRTLPVLMPLTTHALTTGELADAVCRDIRQLTGETVSAVVDLVAGGGKVLGLGGQRYGTFTYQLRGGAR